MVKEGSIQREADGVTCASSSPTPRRTCGRLQGHPARPVQGRKRRVAQGKLGEDGVFAASEVLAKHDENYMPPEAAKAVGDAHARAAANKAAAEAGRNSLADGQP
jgi:cytochrome c-type biogenesis protein CcmE